MINVRNPYHTPVVGPSAEAGAGLAILEGDNQISNSFPAMAIARSI